MEVILRYIMVSRFTSRGCLEVYHGVKFYWWRVSWGHVVKVYWWRLSLGISWFLRFTSGGFLGVYPGVEIY